MQHTKTCYIRRNFCCSILVFVIAICPLFSVADQHDTKSDPEGTPHGQKQNLSPLTPQDLDQVADRLIRQQETFVTRFIVLVILGFLLLVVLICFAWIFSQYRILADELDGVKREIEAAVKVNDSLKNDLLDISEHIQRLARTVNSGALYKKLSTENKNNTREVLTFLESIMDTLQNEGSLRSQEMAEPLGSTEANTVAKYALRSQKMAEPSQQHEGGPGVGMLPSAIVEFCDRYNAGVKEQQRQKNFLEYYEQNYVIDVINAEERRLNSQANPIFKTDEVGYFLACYIEKEKLYAVVPVYGLVVERSTYAPGAFGDVFECSNFNPRRHYRILKIIQPAIFETDDKKETWTFKVRGSLELQET